MTDNDDGAALIQGQWFDNNWPCDNYEPYCIPPEIAARVLKLIQDEVSYTTEPEDIEDVSMLVVGPTVNDIYGAMTFLLFQTCCV